MPKFYTQPKTHKTGNPGRPVVSFVNCHTNTISKYVDFHFQPIFKNIPSHIRDTTDFLKKLDKVKNIPNNCLLVNPDVKALYTNIPNGEGIKAVREVYDNHLNKTVATKVIITFSSLILTLNNFVFIQSYSRLVLNFYFHGSVWKTTYMPTINQHYTYNILMI